MSNEIDLTLLDEIIKKHQINKKTSYLMRQSVNRVNKIDESKTFRYEPLTEFEKRLPHLNSLKKKATELFRPFADRYHIRHFVHQWAFP